MDTRGIPPTQALVKDIAKILLAERVRNALAIRPAVGQHWVYRFINRHSKLKSWYNRKYDYQRAKYEDPEIIRAWLLLIQNTIIKYGITDKDIYNFDKTRFQIGVISIAKVVIALEKARPDWI